MSVSVCLSVFDSVFTRSGSVPNSANEGSRAGADYVPLKDLRPVAERTVAAVYLASSMLRSFRHSCSGRPPSLPAALLIVRLNPASLRRSSAYVCVSVCVSCLGAVARPGASPGSSPQALPDQQRSVPDDFFFRLGSM